MYIIIIIITYLLVARIGPSNLLTLLWQRVTYYVMHTTTVMPQFECHSLKIVFLCRSTVALYQGQVIKTSISIYATRKCTVMRSLNATG